MDQKWPKMAQKLAPSKKNSRDISPVSPTFCISAHLTTQRALWLITTSIILAKLLKWLLNSSWLKKAFVWIMAHCDVDNSICQQIIKICSIWRQCTLSSTLRLPSTHSWRCIQIQILDERLKSCNDSKRPGPMPMMINNYVYHPLKAIESKYRVIERDCQL